MRRVRGTGTDTGEATDTILVQHDNRALLSAWGAFRERQQRLKRTMMDTEVTTGALRLIYGNHRLSHD